MTPPTLLFAHGAGAGQGHPWMQAWGSRLASVGAVVPFEYTYMQAGRRAPDRLPKLLARHRLALDDATADNSGPIVLIGKSMGSRVGCHLSLERPVSAVVCMGYPLVGGGRKKPVRDEVLKQMTAPVLFVQGDRDAMGPLDQFAAVRAEMAAPSVLLVVPGGNHSLVVGKRALQAQGLTQDDVDARILTAIAGFVADHVADTPPP